jgi:hypothetical protein
MVTQDLQAEKLSLILTAEKALMVVEHSQEKILLR